ncbi:MAG: Acetyl xylan esterase [Pedosphaera sp.]|nr:Acetyl xylan esterase [Pedosphaera sp.]
MNFTGIRILSVVLLSLISGWAGQDLVNQIQRPPTARPKDMPQLSPLLQSADGERITSKSGWQRKRAKLREQWMNLLGPLPKQKCPLKMKILATEDMRGFTRQYIKYQVEPDVYVQGYLLTPKDGKGKLPAIVVFHPTTKQKAKIVAGVDLSVPEKTQGVQLVGRGYVVLCPENFIFNGGTNYDGNVAVLKKQHPDWTGMGKMVWDGIRAVDLLESLPNVDKKRIGVIGHSLGAKEALYSAAFDERVKAAVSSEGGIGLKFSNWEAPWYLGKAIQQPDFKLENHQVLSLVAPRAFLLLAGDFADNDKSWAFIETVQPVYKLLGAPENVGWFDHHLGHRYPPEARAIAEEFFDAHLK